MSAFHGGEPRTGLRRIQQCSLFGEPLMRRVWGATIRHKGLIIGWLLSLIGVLMLAIDSGEDPSSAEYRFWLGEAQLMYA